MIRYGCRAGGCAGYSGMRQSVLVPGQRQACGHAREQPERAAATMATHSRLLKA